MNEERTSNMHEKTAEEVRRNELGAFLGRVQTMTETECDVFIAAFNAGFAAGRRGERIEVAARLMTVVLGQ